MGRPAKRGCDMKFFLLSASVLVLLLGACSSTGPAATTIPDETAQVEAAASYFRQGDYINAFRLSQKFKSIEGEAIREYARMYFFAKGGDLWYKPFEINQEIYKIPYPEEMKQAGKEGTIEVSVRVEKDGSVKVGVPRIKNNEPIKDKSTPEYAFFVATKEYLEKQKIEPTIDTTKSEQIGYSETYHVSFHLPDVVQFQKEDVRAPDEMREELFAVLPDLLSCGEVSQVSGKLSIEVSNLGNNPQSIIQTKEYCDDLRSKTNKKEGGAMAITIMRCVPSTVTDEGTINCVRNILSERIQPLQKQRCVDYANLFFSPKLKRLLFPEKSE